jgi:hypothetical protein
VVPPELEAYFRHLDAVLEQQEKQQAEPEQAEPVEWMYRDIGVVRFAEKLPSPGMHKTESVALYTHPPRREWQGLTDDEISALFPSSLRSDYKPYSFARAIEAALKERNT